MSYRYPTAFRSWGPEEYSAVARVIASDRYTQGPEVEAFEAELAAYNGRKYAIYVNSGSSANLVMVAALFHLERNPLQPGDKVIVPAMAWGTTYAPLVQYGLDLVLVDVNAGWNADRVLALEHSFETLRDVKAVVGCSILGNPGDLFSWQQASHQQKIFFLNDDCESLGARINGRTTGFYGLMATQSFFISHQVAGIEGGAILTDDDECAHLCRLIRNHGNAGFLKKNAPFSESYDFRLMGYNLRGLEMHAAVSREQLRKLDGFIEARQRNLAYFRHEAGDLPIELQWFPRDLEGASPFGLQFTVESEDVRGRLVTELRGAGIDCRLPTGGSFRLHKYGERWANQATPNADRIHRTGLFLGNAPFDIADKINAAVKVMRSVL